MSRRTQDTSKRSQDFTYRIITFYDLAFQLIRLSYDFVTPYRKSYNPSPKTGLDYFRFARHYSGNRFFFLFHRLLRCFSSPGYSNIPMYSVCCNWALPQLGSPIRKSPDQSVLTAPRSISLFVTSFISF